MTAGSGRASFSRRWRRCLHALPGALVPASLVVGCTQESTVPPFLIVKVAESRSGEPTDAKHIVVQAGGGGALRIRTQNGRHYIGQEPTARQTSCLAVPEGLLMLWIESEPPGAIVTIDLMLPPPQVDSEPATLVTCRSPVLQSSQILVPTGASAGGSTTESAGGAAGRLPVSAPSGAGGDG